MRSDKNFLSLARARAVECTDTVYSLSRGLCWFLKGYGLQDLCPTRDIDGAASQGRNWDRGCGPLFLITVLLEEEEEWERREGE